MNASDSNEHLSAFVDGELQGPAQDRVVDALYDDPDLRRTWSRFHLIGDAVRGVGPVPGAIAGNEKTRLAGERIVHFRPRVRRSWLRPLSGLAIAAAVAGIAILGVHRFGDDGMQSRPTAGVSHPESTVAGPVPDPVPRIVSRAPPAGPESPRLRWSGVAPDAEARLNAYLVNHNEYAGNGVRGVLPYVRIVGYQSFAGE